MIIEEIIRRSEKNSNKVAVKVDQIVLYFKRTHMKNPIANKKPLIPIGLWNQYDEAREGVAQTTNSVEGWHDGLQAYLMHPRRIFGSFYGTWGASKMEKFRYTQETAG